MDDKQIIDELLELLHEPEGREQLFEELVNTMPGLRKCTGVDSRLVHGIAPMLINWLNNKRTF